MKLGDELAGVKPTPPATQENRRVHRLAGGDEEHQADPTPKDQPKESEMPRKKRKATKTGTPSLHELREQVAADGAPKKRKYTRKAKAAAAPVRATDGARFGVFSDGSVQIDAPRCKGNLSGDDVDLLYAFVSKLREVRK